jgi:hypothetical protein
MILIFHSEAYAGHTQILLVLGIGMLASAIGMPASNALASLENPHAIFWSGLLGATVSIVLSWSLAGPFGVLGAAYGFMAGHIAGMTGRWFLFLVVVRRLIAQKETASEIPDLMRAGITSVLSQLSVAPGSIRQISRLGEGDEAIVFEVRVEYGTIPGRQPPPMAVKLYKSAAVPTVDLVQHQFAALSECNRALVGHSAGGWTVSMPTPLFVSIAPPALVMTAVQGKPIFQGWEQGNRRPLQDLGSCARAVVSALERLWAQGIQHGDLNLENILCDVPGKAISFIDPSEPTAFGDTERMEDPLYCASCDLGHLLYEEATNVRPFIGRPGLRKHRWMFIETILCAQLETIDCLAAKLSLVAHIRSFGRANLAMMRFSWSPQGLWRICVKTIAARQIDRMANHLIRELRQHTSSNSAPRLDRVGHSCR